MAATPATRCRTSYFHLDDGDRELARRRRVDHMRLGFAIQLATVRFLGTFLDDPTAVPAVVVRVVAAQLGIADPDGLARYRDGKTRWDHAAEIRERYGFREFGEPSVHFRLARWLYALCWTGTERSVRPGHRLAGSPQGVAAGRLCARAAGPVPASACGGS
jgi:hypothetical protein